MLEWSCVTSFLKWWLQMMFTISKWGKLQPQGCLTKKITSVPTSLGYFVHFNYSPQFTSLRFASLSLLSRLRVSSHVFSLYFIPFLSSFNICNYILTIVIWWLWSTGAKLLYPVALLPSTYACDLHTHIQQTTQFATNLQLKRILWLGDLWPFATSIFYCQRTTSSAAFDSLRRQSLLHK